MSISMLLAVSLALPQAEFAKYHELITGQVPDEGLVSFAVNPSILTNGNDAYTIASDRFGARITGSNLRSVLYGVYDLLERRGGCRWFWDGDVVPKKESIDLSGLDVREESRFQYRAIRYFAHRGLTRFQAEHWNLDDWKREIDWCVKRRINCIMPRIGMDDTWQKACPDIVPYPDPSKPIPEAGKGYDDRSLFWSLEYRGKLRKAFTEYALERGLMIPTDFGTMTHWYSRTPETFLEKEHPPFLPQASKNYGLPNARVFDIRERRWLDAYWRLTEAFVEAGYGTYDLLHTIGLGERMVFEDRAKNLEFKVDVMQRLFNLAAEKAPNSPILLAGWDFYYCWTPEEVRSLLPRLNPKRVLIWDYEADAHDRTNFTEWGVVGRFPYTFGIFLTLEQGLDVRADYSRIIERQRIAVADPMCRGYILWPESSHTDQLCLNYFAANAWDGRCTDVDDILSDMCRGRYGTQADKLRGIWKDVVAVSTNCFDTWRDNCGRASLRFCRDPKAMEEMAGKAVPLSTLKSAPEILRALADVEWTGDFVRRDTIDLARTAADRLMLALMGNPNGNARNVAALMDGFTDLLALHTDYSLAESMDRLDAIERIRYPGFGKTLFANAVNGYCASHHYEAFAYIYLPWWRHFAETGKCLEGDSLLAAFSKPLHEMRPTLARTRENYRRTMRKLADAAERPFK